MFRNFFSKPKKSVNCEPRPNNAEPYILLLHYTGMQSASAALERMTDPSSKVSAHYMIDEDGARTLLVDEEFRAWHAGASFWAGEDDINSYSIGVEIVNPGHEWGYRPFPQVQMDAVLQLCQEIMTRHDIRYVLAHSDVAPERRYDPGELFDWTLLAENGVGILPAPTSKDYEEAKHLSVNDFEVEKLFVKYGYNPMTAFVDVVTAFHRHYYPKAFEGGHEGEVCEETVARLLSLIRLQKEKGFRE